MFDKSRFQSRGFAAVVLFLASTVPFGIAAHLTSEFVGLGWHDDAEVMFSARHAYLAVIAAIVLFALVAHVARFEDSQRRARIAQLIDGLPFGGRGARFTLLSFAAQFAFFAATQLGEGCPLCAGDVLVGVVAAAIAAAIGALAIALGQRRLVELVFAIVAAYRAVSKMTVVAVRAARRRSPFALAARAAAFSFRYRPPPLAAA